MSGHSEHGASICKRWWNCPGSVALVRGMPNTASEHARRGTAAHRVAELCLLNKQDAAEYVDLPIQLEDGTAFHDFDAPMAEAVQVYLDECRGPIEHDGAADWHDFNFLRDAHAGCWMVEAQFDLAPLNPPVPMFGTSDFVAYNPTTRKLYVKDYKNGFGAVEAQGNPQLKYYALGAMVALGAGKPISEVEATIVQPNGGGAPIKRATYQADELAEWSVELMARAAATLEPDAPLVAGEWCKFCPAAGTCRARAGAALAVAQVEFADVGAPRLPDPKLLTPEQVGGILAQADLFESWLGDVRSAAMATLQRGEAVPGWKLAEGQTRETWKDAEAAALDLQLEHGLAEADVYEAPKLRSFAQIRDVLAAGIGAGSKITKKAATEQARDALRPLTYRPPGKPALVPAADARPALAPAGSEFSTLEST